MEDPRLSKIKITVDEMETVLNDEKILNEMLSNTFQFVDINKNGLMDYPEFYYFYKDFYNSINYPFLYDDFEGRLSLPTHEEARKKFDELDTQNSGNLTKNQYKSFYIIMLKFGISYLNSLLNN
jgi:Ca2+-binding EF-hand superfamily protein